MKKGCLILITFLFVATTSAFAGGDQNQNCHDGEKGKGTVTQNPNRK